MNNYIEKHIALAEKNKDYNELLENHSHTELYFEMIHFMALAFPNWNSNYGIGEIAPEFILTSIQNLDFVEDFNEGNTFENLKAIYFELVDNYPKSKSWYQSHVSEKIYNKFNEAFPDESELDELSKTDYDKLYNEFSKNEMSKILYEF